MSRLFSYVCVVTKPFRFFNDQISDEGEWVEFQVGTRLSLLTLEEVDRVRKIAASNGGEVELISGE